MWNLHSQFERFEKLSSDFAALLQEIEKVISQLPTEGYIYLATPYTSKIEGERNKRYRAVTELTVELTKKGFIIFSPISYMHPIAEKYNLPLEFDFWHKFDETFVKKASALLVLQLPGWRESKGVTEEIQIAASNNIPVFEFPDFTELKNTSSFYFDESSF